MNKENMKNMVILRDLPSNIVEEAIVILKPNVKLKSLNIAEKENRKIKKNDVGDPKKYIINEAQMVISNYLTSIEKQKKKSYNTNKKIENKYKRAKIICTCLGIALLLSIIIR
ncbi:MAG: hypothetical protein J5507_04150 [Clostridia bacterium]|nr:hypothetical protein [Clostridia bacterium]